MSTIFLSDDANAVLKSYLREKGHGLIEVGRTPFVYDAIASHPDIYLCKIADELILAKEQLPYIQPALGAFQVKFRQGASALGSNYPETIIYNGAQMGKYFIHYTAHTDPVLLQAAKDRGLEIISVRQGYTKCNLVVVDEHSAITADEGMAKVLAIHGLDVLLVQPGHAALTGFPYGFLGGASGKVGKEIIFHGDLSLHPDFQAIKGFIENRHLQLTYFTQFPLTDIGSIIEY